MPLLLTRILAGTCRSPHAKFLHTSIMRAYAPGRQRPGTLGEGAASCSHDDRNPDTGARHLGAHEQTTPGIKDLSSLTP
jgi:hypothetical protein